MEGNDKINKKNMSENKRSRLEKAKFQKSLQGMTTEEKIAANKARVAKYHPDPDMTSNPTGIRRALSKLNFEKGLKRIYMRVVSIPMGGLKKR